MTILIEPLAGSFARKVSNIDLERDLSDGDKKAIVDAWIDAGVLVFPGLGKSVEAHMRLSRCLGDLEIAPTKHLHSADNPYLLDLSYDPAKSTIISDFHVELNGEKRGGYLSWHWDLSYTPVINRGAVLRMIEPPERGGETGFIDAAAAYERLPDSLKQRLEDLEVVYQARSVHNPISFGVGAVSTAVTSDDAPDRERFPPTVHPMIIVQEETGRKVLNLSPMLCDYVLGWDRESSQRLFEEIATYLLDESFAYFHHWDVDDMIAWDNWRVIHNACGVPPHMRRRVMRTTIIGDYKLGRLLDPSLSSSKLRRGNFD